MPIVSVIVPIYNVERYLCECIDSILNQSFKDFELILVDDGSPDSCPFICDEYAKRDNRIRVIHKSNGGLSSARNAGLELATGKYILFVDSDDFVMPQLLSISIRKLEDSKCDCLRFGYNKIDNQGNILYTKKMNSHLHVFNSDNDKLNFICNQLLSYKIPFTSWSCLYKNSIIKKNNLVFASEREIYSEDSFFSTLYSFYSNSCFIISDVLYCYRLNANSLMGQYKKNKVLQINKCIEWSKQLYRCCPNPFLKERFFEIAISFYKNEIKFSVDKVHVKYCVDSVKIIDDRNYFQNQFENYLKSDIKPFKQKHGRLEGFKEKTFCKYLSTFNLFIFRIRIFALRIFRVLKGNGQ